MLRIFVLLAFFAAISLSINAQTETNSPPGGSHARAEPASCEAIKDASAEVMADCLRVRQAGGRAEKPRLAQAPDNLQELFVKAGTRLNPPLSDQPESGRTVLIPRFQVPSMNPSEPNNQHPSHHGNGHSGFKWRPALKQYLLLLAVEHAFDLTQEKTRRELKGPFIKDYFRSVRGLGGWSDGGKFFTNYVAHPMGGSAHGWIYIQNDPRGLRAEFGKSKEYWVSRMKAMAWSAACSAQFEIGPLSQAAIGNVGLYTPHSGKGKRKMAYVDFVITPTVGTLWTVGEDVAERYILRRMENGSNPLLTNVMRLVLTPTRSAANLLRFKKPWYRDNYRRTPSLKSP